jgi:hypothetical protein
MVYKMLGAIVFTSIIENCSKRIVMKALMQSHHSIKREEK